MKSNFKDIGEMFKYYKPCIYKGVEVKEIIVAIEKEINILLEESILSRQKAYDRFEKEMNLSKKELNKYFGNVVKEYPLMDKYVSQGIVFGEIWAYHELLNKLKGINGMDVKQHNKEQIEKYLKNNPEIDKVMDDMLDEIGETILEELEGKGENGKRNRTGE